MFFKLLKKPNEISISLGFFCVSNFSWNHYQTRPNREEQLFQYSHINELSKHRRGDIFSMKKVNVAILGVMGSVGTEILKVLEERKFPVDNLKLLASKKYAGREIIWNSLKYVVEEVTKDSFDDVDILLSAVPSEASKIYTPIAVEKGVVVIDNSSAYRYDENVPLVIPEINPEDVETHEGIIANPNCSTIIALLPLSEINKLSLIKRIIASTYQAASGAGNKGMEELERQTKDYANEKELEVKAFHHQILHNVIPQVDNFTENGYTKEEMKMVNESRKILHNKNINISCTSVRVPVLRSHSVSMIVETEDDVSVEKAKELLSKSKGIKIVDDIERNIYPMPKDSSNQDLVFVGRIRKDLSGNGLNLWCCGDQIRKGAATNAVQIAELLVSSSNESSDRSC